ncbi:M4 family metallopeptidase [Actinomycetospora rhizophila]|uniref:Neutral metalloproteinase n=1 Tax=Actinomycetospora rhizophila TaxID=1416876 RepID=A0ABV9ZNB9_9PSEU
MADDGLSTFTLHRDDQQPIIAAINEEVADTSTRRPASLAPDEVDPETAARRYLREMVARPEVPTPTADVPADTPEYRTIATETLPLTDTTTVKFAQYFHRVPVYGSLVTIELERDNTLLSISSTLAEPTGVDPVARVSPLEARDAAHAAAGIDRAGDDEQRPRLYYYRDSRAQPPTWRLVYMVRDVLRDAPGDDGGGPTTIVPDLVDYVVDAHDGGVVAVLPRTQSVGPGADEEIADDALGEPRRFRVLPDGAGRRWLRDPELNVRTHDFEFQDAFGRAHLLPGDGVSAPPEPWSPAAVSAHANAAEVARFLVEVLRRDGLDGRGGSYVSSINCVDGPAGANREWRNAAWFRGQMIYGQRRVGGQLQSYAAAGDVVAHEIVHGLTDNTAGLEYVTESGALNESYSDILGIIIANRNETDIARWDWELGEDLDGTGVPLRDLSDPAHRGQPAHMDDFLRLPPGVAPSRSNDWGFVHSNSGIHNKAAYGVLTATHADGTHVFAPAEGAALFYLALTQHLSRRSGFDTSRRGVELAARTLFRRDPPATRAAKLAAIGEGFDAVGIEGADDATVLAGRG